MNRAYRVLTGPTAAGKTACLLERAKHSPLALVSADSRQVCRGMDIGTGKPTPADFKILPHHLLDFVEPPISFSVYQFIIECARIFRELEGSASEIWVCGGTGLYIRTLVADLPLRSGPRPTLRVTLEELLKHEPASEAAARLGIELAEARNPVRVIRACEAACADDDTCQRLYKLLGLDGTALAEDAAAASPAPGFDAARAYLRRWQCAGIAVLDPGVEALQQLIARRVRAMFMEGLLDEVARLRELGYGATPVVRDGIAYREALALLDGTLELEAAIAQAVIRTRQYAKRQRTYFRGQGWPFHATCQECLNALGVD
jgi:tRNA dimethylallyltransferase